MKTFQDNQKVFVIYLKQIFEATITWGNKKNGVHYIDEIKTYPFAHLKNGLEAVFETRQQAQEYLHSLT